MTGETETLVLEPLRGIRAEIGALRLDGIDATETPLEGWRHVAVATTGPLATDLEGHGARIAALEGPPA